jgi:hypothetical protein
MRSTVSDGSLFLRAASTPAADSSIAFADCATSLDRRAYVTE